MSHHSVTQSRGHFRPMLRLAWPVLAEESLTLLVGWTDLFLVGQFIVGQAPKAAMGLMSYTMWLIPSMFAAVSVGSIAIVSRFIGARKPGVANIFANQAFAVGSLFCLVILLLAAFFHQPFIGAMSLEGESAELAMRYLGWVIPIIPFIMIQQVGAACLRGAGDTVSGLFAKIIVVLVNLALSITLVTGYGIAPELGWDGVAIGTAVGHGIGGIIIWAILLRGRAGIRFRFRWLIPRFTFVRKLLKVGLPGGFDIAAVLFCQLLFLSFVNSLGTLQAAAHAVTIQIEAAAYLPGTAFQVAAATMAGQFLGARLPDRAMRSVLVCCLSGLVVICTSGTIVYLFAESIAGFFIHPADVETLNLACELLRIVAWAMPALAVVMVLSGALRGAGDTKWPFLITLIGFLLIRIPLAYWLALDEIQILGTTLTGFGLGIQGAWYAMLIDLVCRSIMLTMRTVNGGWLKVRI